MTPLYPYILPLGEVRVDLSLEAVAFQLKLTFNPN